MEGCQHRRRMRIGHGADHQVIGPNRQRDETPIDEAPIDKASIGPKSMAH